MTLNQILAILRARWLAALLAFSVIFGGIAGITLWLPKLYTATASVLIDVKNTDPLNGQTFGGIVPMSYMVTQVDVIRSGRVVKQVIDSLALRDNQPLRDQWREEDASGASFDGWLMDLLRKRLEVRPTKDSGALDINYTSPDPRFSAAMANAFAQAYVATSIQLRTEPAKQSSAFFEGQAKAAREALENAQSRLSAFQQRNGLLANEDRFDVEMARLQELSSQQVTLQALSAESRGRNAQAQSNPSQTQEVLNNALVTSLSAELNKLQVKFEEMKLRLGDAHPDLVQARASIEELRSRIAVETSRVSGSVASNNDVVGGRLGAVSAALAGQRARVLQMKQVRSEASVLEREVESTRLAYQNLMMRQSAVSLESQTDRSNVSLLETATPPLKPSSPKVLLNIAIGIVLGLIGAIALALLREWRDRKLRTLDDVQDLLKIRVLGIIPRVTPNLLAKESAMPGLVRTRLTR